MMPEEQVFACAVAKQAAEKLRTSMEAWRAVCNDGSPGALMFPRFERKERKGQEAPLVKNL